MRSASARSALPVMCLAATCLAGAAAAAEETLPPIEGFPFEIGRLDSSSIRAAGPRVFFSPEEIAQARVRVEEDERARAVLDRLVKDADRKLAIEIEPVDETWWEAAKDKSWAQTYPQVFEHTWIRPMAYAKPASTLAAAWLLTDEPRYADKAAALLRNLAPYSFQAEHYDVGMNYSVWGIEALKAYDVLMPRMSAEQRSAFDACMTRLAWAVGRNDAYWLKHEPGGRINNHLAWHKMMFGLLGLFYDRGDMVDYCLHGPRGLVPLLEDGLIDDGLWCESSLNYQFAAIAPMIAFADAQRRMGRRPGLHEIVAANGRTLKQSCDAMFNVLAPDGLIPPIGDAYGHHRRLWEVSLYEYAWALWRDPKYAWLMSRNPEPSPYSLWAPPMPEHAPAPPIRSVLLPEHGYAFLRSHTDDAYWDNPNALCAFLTYDRSNVHANADKLSLMLFGRNRMLLSDVEGRTVSGHAFSSDIQRELNRGALSQNTVMIDGHDQRCGPKMLELIEFRDLPGEKRVTAADKKSLLYDGVRQMRTVAMTADYVLDVFQVKCAKPSQIDWVMHVLNEKASLPANSNPVLSECEPFPLPEAGAWRWLRDARSFAPTGPVRLEWREGEGRVRLQMLDPGAERIILCGFPYSNEPDPPTIPMVIVRKRGKTAVFAALWLTGNAIKKATLSQLPAHDELLVYQVDADGRQRRHLVPLLRER